MRYQQCEKFSDELYIHQEVSRRHSILCINITEEGLNLLT